MMLNVVLALPLAGFLLLLTLPRAKESLFRIAALTISLVTFALSVGLAAAFFPLQPGQRFVTDVL